MKQPLKEQSELKAEKMFTDRFGHDTGPLTSHNG